MRCVPASDTGLLVEFGSEFSPELSSRVLSFFHALRSTRDPRIVNLHPAYASLLITFDPVQSSHEEIEELVAGVQVEDLKTSISRVEVPVCYGGEFGPDLQAVAECSGCAVEEVIQRHAAPEYMVCFLGFSPGFPYMAGLDSSLEMPRLDSPRTQVPAGSVGIAGAQTGIYPVESPGGWRIIGRTPLVLFTPASADPTLLHPGDRVQFVPITQEQFEAFQI